MSFYCISPWDEQQPDFADRAFPLDEAVRRIRSLDAAAPDYRFTDALFGNERFCHVDTNGPTPLWCLYTKDVTSAPETERKGEIRSLELDPDEGIVDASYAIILPGDVVAIVQTSPKAPGSAFFARWVSTMSGVHFYLAPVPNLAVTERLAALRTTVRKVRLGCNVRSLNSPDVPRSNLASELRALAKPGTDTVVIERANRQQRNRVAFANSFMEELDEVREMLPFLKEANVWVTGQKRAIKLDGLHLKTEVPFGVNEHRRVTPRTAAEGLLEAYEREQPTVISAEALYRQSRQRRRS